VRRVLLVDENEAVRTVLSLLLQREGWEVTACADVDDAERAFVLNPCDVVLSDLVMPDKGALELLALLRQHDPRLAFVVMSGYLTDERFKEVLQAGASDCLSKPCENDDLIRALSRAIVLRNSVQETHNAKGEHSIVLSVPAQLNHRARVITQVDLAAQVGGFDLRRNRILMALDEAFTNAVVHGAGGNPKLSIEVHASFSHHGGVVTISDPGPGFDPALAEIIKDEAHSQRGLYLIRAACDDARWLSRGNVCQMLFKQPPVDEKTGRRETTATHIGPKTSKRTKVSGGKLATAKKVQS
jgi:CheY-like chemotaxis protein/anti-sigma regulatory factor (Ser/Thr protein kinase)